MTPPSLAQRLAAIDTARADGTITDHSARTMRAWLTEPRYAEFVPELAVRIDAGTWKELDDVYWTVIPFGTGGRRGTMYPVGSNAINDRTIGESAQGLADYVRSVLPAGETPTCSIAYDTRHRSEHFAKLCAEVLLAAGFRALKPGGTLVYSTCSFARAQNEAIVEAFVRAEPRAELVPIESLRGAPCRAGDVPHTLRFEPRISQTSGLFVAKLTKLAGVG
jgi:RimJ/RimL family protein N-acetyltransferase